MPAPSRAPAADFGILLGLAFQTFTDELRAHLADAGFDDLGSAYGYVFRALSDEELHLTELAARLGMTDPGAVKIVHEMEKRGYVERRPDPDDARAKRLRLAARGRAALAAARRFHAAFERRLAKATAPHQVETTRRTLELLVGTTGTDAARARLRAL
ncbi:MAG TPA: helix-turn-helix domain-containing protein [Polyangiaceae bacterium]|jgi:DNA-binding MarR family transcriptional regulator|nr:helix-turn-helix domain-containing protein [Polyangiaceae bacterium]